MPKTKERAWSVAGQKMLDGIKNDTPSALAEQIREAANQRGLIDVFGEGFEVDAQGKPMEQGIGSTTWLLNVSDARAEQHYTAIGRWRGPAAERAERERIARLKGAKK